jgi:hypothetical protein
MLLSGGSLLSEVDLRERFERLRRADPFVVLGVDAAADGDAVRAAFLGLTKQLHPNRYARESALARELVTELFLLVRKAYDQLASDEGRARWRRRVAQGQGAEVTPPPSQRPVIAVGPSAAPTPAPSPPDRVASTTGSPTLGPGVPTPQAAPGPRAVGPGAPAAPTPVPQRTAPPRGNTVPGPGMGPGAPAPPPLATSTPTTSTPTPNPAARSPTVRPGPGGAGSTVPPRGNTTSGVPGGPPRPDVQSLLDQAKTRQSRFDDAVRDLLHGRVGPARESLQKLVAEDPGARRFRTYFHLALGLEAMADARWPEARRELDRAAELDRENGDVRTALTQLDDKEAAAKKRGGLFGKLFGK